MENMSKRENEKRKKEENIVLSAEKIFIQKGFEAASMDEIAKESQLTKRTVYQYFENKEELYFGVVLKAFECLFFTVSEAYGGDGNGYEKIYQSYRNFYQFFRTYPDKFRIISYWSNRKKNSVIGGKYYCRLLDFNGQMFQKVALVLEEGKSDGSIKKEFDSTQTAYSLIFLITGFFNQLASTGESFTKAFSIDMETFCYRTFDFVLEGLKSNGESTIIITDKRSGRHTERN